MEKVITKYETLAEKMTFGEYREKVKLPKRAYQNPNWVGYHVIEKDYVTNEVVFDEFVQEGAFLKEFTTEALVKEALSIKEASEKEESEKKAAAKAKIEEAIEAKRAESELEVRIEAPLGEDEEVIKPKRKRKTKVEESAE